MAYNQIQCALHGRQQCRSCMPHLQQRRISALHGHSHIDQEQPHAPSNLDQCSSAAGPPAWNTPEQHALRATGSMHAGAEATALTFPSPMQSSTQNRRQIQQRFDDLHMGVSSNARAIFNYQALDSTNTELRATISALDTM